MPRKGGEPSHAGLMAIYDCLCDETRVRILNLLLRGSLCVGDFQEILRRPQVFVSKHLAYLRGRGMVQAERFGNWVIYSVPKVRSRELEANLRCLLECTRGHAVFREDLRRLRVMAKRMGWKGEAVLDATEQGTKSHASAN